MPAATDAVDTRLGTFRARLDPERLPAHIAIIMDGNGRWARQKRLPSRLLGHREGYRTAKKVVKDAADLGIRFLTLYAFSNENWSRPESEVEGLMTLIEHATRSELAELHESGVRMRFVGRRDGLSKSLLAAIEKAESLTERNTGLGLSIALNYGGRAEIVDAARALAADVASGVLAAADIDEAAIARRLYAPDIPDPDLLVRTAGELRVSNFLLWEIAYAEIWVTPTLWPDFSTELLVQAIEDYQRRVRKFGAVVKT